MPIIIYYCHNIYMFCRSCRNLYVRCSIVEKHLSDDMPKYLKIIETRKIRKKNNLIAKISYNILIILL